MESIRSITVSIEVDTNKRTMSEKLERGSEETRAEFAARIEAALDDMLEATS